MMNHTSHTFGENLTYLLKSIKGEELLVRQWNAINSDKPKGVIIGIHGGMAHSGDWILPAQFFNAKGYEMHALDLPGHGTFAELNRGKVNILDIESFDLYVEHVHDLVQTVHKQHQNTPIYIFGHSMGGLIALMYGLGKGRNQDFIKGFGISSPWLKDNTKPPMPRFMVRIIASLLPKLRVPLNLDLNQLTQDKAVLKRHQRDIESGLRGVTVTPRFAVVSEQAQDKLKNELCRWNEYPLAVAIAGKDELANAQFTLQQMESIQAPLANYHYYENNLHENFNEMNRLEVFQYISDTLKM